MSWDDPWRNNLIPPVWLRQFTEAFLCIGNAFLIKPLILWYLFLNISQSYVCAKLLNFVSEPGAVWSHCGRFPSCDSGPTKSLSTLENFAGRVCGSGCNSNR